MPISTHVTSWSADDPVTTVGVDPDMYFPKYVTLLVTDEPDIDVDVKIWLVFDPYAKRYLTDGVHVTRRDQTGDVSSVAIRAVRVQEFVQRGTERLPKLDRPDGPSIVDLLTFDLMMSVRRAGPGDLQTMLWVTRLYRMAAATSSPPVKMIADTFHISTASASVWVRRARDQGLLEEAEAPQLRMSSHEFRTAREVLGSDEDG